MATAAKKTTTRSRTRVSPALEPASLVVSGLAKDLASKANAEDQPQDVATEGDPEVIATVIKPFTLTLNDGSSRHYDVGAQRMPKSHADHWYAKAHGVKSV